MTETVSHPRFRPQDFDPAQKKNGISAVIRLHNEADYLTDALNSIFPFFDEFIIVFNRCTDRTPEIVEAFVKKDPRRVKAYHYGPEVFPQGSEMHRKLSPKHVSSLVYYTNFALSKASYKLRAMWDGDMIAAPTPFSKVVHQLRNVKKNTLTWWMSPWKIGFWYYQGLNLWDESGKIFVNRSHPVSGSRKDHGFWSTSRHRIYRYYPNGEYLRKRFFVNRKVGFVFFHVKSMKVDRGLGVYQFHKNPNSYYKTHVEKWWTSPQLVSFDTFCSAHPDARSLPSPESLAIQPVRDDASSSP